MKKLRYGIPTPPAHALHHHAYELNGMLVCYIWVFDDEGARIIENQYVSARKMMSALGCSQATAYRLLAAENKRYWVADLRDKDKPRCYSALPRRRLSQLEVQPVGNPGWRSGIYQQGMRRRRH